MVTKSQIQNIRAKLGNLTLTVDKMKQVCDTALYEYQVGSTTKTLPQPDVDALVDEYRTLKATLKTQVDALP